MSARDGRMLTLKDLHRRLAKTADGRLRHLGQHIIRLQRVNNSNRRRCKLLKWAKTNMLQPHCEKYC